MKKLSSIIIKRGVCMKKLSSTIIAIILIVAIFGTISASAAELDLTTDKWTISSGATINDGVFTFPNYGYVYYDFAESEKGLSGSVEADVFFKGSGSWVCMGFGYAYERIVFSLQAVGDAYVDNEPQDNVTITLTRASDSFKLATFYTTLDYQVHNKLSFCYSFSIPPARMNVSAYVNGKEIVSNTNYFFTASLDNLFKYDKLLLEAKQTEITGYKWSSIKETYIPALTLSNANYDKVEKGKATDDFTFSLSKTSTVTGIKANGIDLTQNNYTYDAVSRVVTVKKEYINEILVGDCTFELFNDTTSLGTIVLKIEEPSSASSTSSTSLTSSTQSNANTSSTSSTQNNANTNDSTNMSILVIILLLSMAILAFVINKKAKA